MQPEQEPFIWHDVTYDQPDWSKEAILPGDLFQIHHGHHDERIMLLSIDGKRVTVRAWIGAQTFLRYFTIAYIRRNIINPLGNALLLAYSNVTLPSRVPLP